MIELLLAVLSFVYYNTISFCTHAIINILFSHFGCYDEHVSENVLVLPSFDLGQTGQSLFVFWLGQNYEMYVCFWVELSYSDALFVVVYNREDSVPVPLQKLFWDLLFLYDILHCRHIRSLRQPIGHISLIGIFNQILWTASIWILELLWAYLFQITGLPICCNLFLFPFEILVIIDAVDVSTPGLFLQILWDQRVVVKCEWVLCLKTPLQVWFLKPGGSSTKNVIAIDISFAWKRGTWEIWSYSCELRLLTNERVCHDQLPCWFDATSQAFLRELASRSYNARENLYFSFGHWNNRSGYHNDLLHWFIIIITLWLMIEM